MPVDIAPELITEIKRDFKIQKNANSLIRLLTAKFNNGQATYEDANNYAKELGNILAKIYKKKIASSRLPDGRLYYNMAERLLNETLTLNINLINSACESVQTSLNSILGVGIKAVTPSINQDRINGLIDKVSDAEIYDDAAWVLEEPVINLHQSVVDDYIQANVDFHGNLGLSPVVVRKQNGKCCEWCSNLVGTYKYPDIPRDVYHRHERCRCTVEYISGNGKVQDVWSKKIVKNGNELKSGTPSTGRISGTLRERAAIAAQEGDAATIPAYLVNDFSDFQPLTISHEEKEILKTLHNLSINNNYEYAQIISENTQSEILSNNEFGRVRIPIDDATGDKLNVLHAHTNDTPLSAKDLTFLLNNRVEKVEVITRNGDVFNAQIGTGEIPSTEDFDSFIQTLKREIDNDIIELPNFFELDIPERNYVACREQFFRTIRHFGWLAEGGTLYGE